ncbi:MAG: permease [Actinobacteria bacterium]|nr:permease [Actinomycetota bacterium]
MKENKKKTFNLKNFLKQYLFFIITLVLLGILFIFKFDEGLKATDVIVYSFKEMLFVLPPIFILIGLLDVWVEKETMIKLMGEGSGFKGILLAFLFGTVAAGPLYAAFPVAIIFMKKQVKFFNIIIFLGAWSTTKIPMLLYEMSALGFKFALLRLAINIPVIVITAYIMGALIKKDDVIAIYGKTEDF